MVIPFPAAQGAARRIAAAFGAASAPAATALGGEVSPATIEVDLPLVWRADPELPLAWQAPELPLKWRFIA